jgi:hypothetical protein
MTNPAIKNKQPAAANRKSPSLKTEGGKEISVSVEYNDQLRDLFGVKSRRTADGLLLCALHSMGKEGELYRNLMTEMAVEVEPKDAIEAMLVSQMTATHVVMSKLSARTIDADSPQLREGYERSMTRLSRTFIAQMDVLKKYRAKAQQVVRVERVTVHEGGQAIVGPVAHGGRADGEK